MVISCAGVGYAVQVPLTTAEACLPPGGRHGVYCDERDRKRCFAVRLCHRGAAQLLQDADQRERRWPQGRAGHFVHHDAGACGTGGVQRGHKAFTKANGVGPKLAQRIALELKDKVGKGLADGTGFGGGAAAAAPAPSSAPARL